MKDLHVVKGFAQTQGESLDEEKFRALKSGDLILVQLDRQEPEIGRFVGFGRRSPIIATYYLGYNYSYCFVDGSQKSNPQSGHHIYSVHRSRVLGVKNGLFRKVSALGCKEGRESGELTQELGVAFWAGKKVFSF